MLFSPRGPLGWLRDLGPPACQGVKGKPVIPRERANQDVDELIAYDLAEGSERAALGFIDALEQAYAHIGRHPATGSPRYAHEPGVPGLRAWHPALRLVPFLTHGRQPSRESQQRSA